MAMLLTKMLLICFWERLRNAYSDNWLIYSSLTDCKCDGCPLFAQKTTSPAICNAWSCIFCYHCCNRSQTI